jgi:hypothetical protein
VANARDDFVIGCFRAGAIDDEELSRLVADAWAEAIVDPVDAAEIASILDIAKEKLRIFPPPIVVEVRSGGITGAEMALVFAGAFAGAYAKELGSEAGRSASKATIKLVRKIWDKALSRRVRSVEAEALGEEMPWEEEPH